MGIGGFRLTFLQRHAIASFAGTAVAVSAAYCWIVADVILGDMSDKPQRMASYALLCMIVTLIMWAVLMVITLPASYVIHQLLEYRQFAKVSYSLIGGAACGVFAIAVATIVLALRGATGNELGFIGGEILKHGAMTFGLVSGVTALASIAGAIGGYVFHRLANHGTDTGDLAA